jgi:hypothetical protein
MDRPVLDITISRTGQVTVEIRGAKGPRCLKYAELLRELVGREAQRRLTREYYEPEQNVRIDAEVRARKP